MSEQKKRRMGDWPDAVWLRKLDPMHAFIPYVLPNRADNEAFIMETADLTNALAYLEKKNAEDINRHYTLFHILTAAIVKTITLRPKLNRFIKGWRIYEREGVSVSFTMKKQFSDDAHESLVILSFDENTTVDSVQAAITGEVTRYRGGKTDDTTDIMSHLLRLPRPVMRLVMAILRFLDNYGRLPRGFAKADPYHSTVFIANLGSIGLGAGYHHLTNWGTNSLFITLGAKRKTPILDASGAVTTREVMDIGLTLDERIADGYYDAGTVKLLLHLLKNPELLEKPAKEQVIL